MLRAPVGSEFDPSEEAEGSIDPLGLQAGYERLADRLLPAVTVRMGRPRYVTAMALGACVCGRWQIDTVAADEITPPWLVYEWMVVESFVRAGEAIPNAGSIPGIQKVRNAIRAGRPIGAPTYLKTPGVFGFSGVFRRLARDIGILTEDGGLDDGGIALLVAWGKDERLEGILDASSGAAHEFRERLGKAVAQGLAKGHTTSQSKEFWRELATRLDPSQLRRNESRTLLQLLLASAGPKVFVEQLRSALVAEGGVSSRDDEPFFLRKLHVKASADLKELLSAIDAYETFGRVITDAFDVMRYLSTANGGSFVDSKDFAASPLVPRLMKRLRPSVTRIKNHTSLLDWETPHKGLAQSIEYFEPVKSAADLFTSVLEYHAEVQHNKPPEPKRTWFEQNRAGAALVRAAYRLAEPPDGVVPYVHEYRVPTFSGFLADLGAYR